MKSQVTPPTAVRRASALQRLLMFGAADLLLGLLALVVPAYFVQFANQLLGYLLGGTASLASSYGVVLTIAAATFELIRNFASDRSDSTLADAALWREILIVMAAGIFFYKYFSAAQLVTVDEVIHPFISYALSVVFCLGLGYSAARLFAKIIFRR